MKKLVKECMDQIVFKVAKQGANSASLWDYYQPKEPAGLKKLKNNKEKRGGKEI